MNGRAYRGRRAVAIAALAALGLAGASCGDDDGGGDASAPTGGDSVEGGESSAPTGSADVGGDEECTAERAGGELTSATGGPLAGMSPYVAPGTGWGGGDYLSAFYDTLMRYDATTQTFEPNVAESLEPNDDHTEWTLTLRPDVTFGNGDILTTADVQAHVKRFQEDSGRAAGMAVEIQSMEVVDEQTMVFDVGEPWGSFPYVLSAELGWVPNHRIVQERGDDSFNLDSTGAGVGPYELARYAPGEEIVLTAKDDYWGGPVCIETLTFKYGGGGDTTYEAFQTGDFDTAFIDGLTVATEAEEAGDLGFQVEVGTIRYVLADQGITGSTDSPFTDVRVREALQLAVDYDLINQRLYDGVGISTSSIVAPESPLSPGVEGPPYDPERATQLVEELKAEGAWDGKLELLVASTPFEAEMGVLFEGMWEAVGIDVTLDQVSLQESNRRTIVDPNFEVASLGSAVMDPAPWTQLNGFESDSPRNRTGYASPAMDEALAGLRAASTIDETKEALGEVQRVWNEEYPVISWDHGIWGIAVADNVHGMEYGPDNTPYFHDAWIE